MSNEEAQELVCILEKEKLITLEEGADCMLAFAILSLIISGTLMLMNIRSHSELTKK